MEKIDAQLEQRVWQRVRGEERPVALQPLAAAEMNLAAVYRMLMGMYQGPEKAVLRRLFEEERRHSRMLAGIHLLREGKPMTARGVPPEGDRPETALRKCYAQTLRAMRSYSEQANDAEYGHVFREMARQEEEHARLLLELLGSAQR